MRETGRRDGASPAEGLRAVGARVVRHASLLPAAGVVLLLTSPAGGLELLASSPDPGRSLGSAEVQLGSGPCWTAFRLGSPVGAVSEKEMTHRWPQFAAAGTALGVRSVYAAPLIAGGERVGVLVLYLTDDGGLDRQGRSLALAMADLAATALHSTRRAAAEEERTRQLQHALGARVTIEQAKGMLMATAGWSPQAAFTAMRQYARHHRVKVVDVARDVTSRNLTFLDLFR